MIMELLKDFIIEHPEKLLNIIMAVIGFIVTTYGTWIATKWSAYVGKLHEKIKNEALYNGFRLIEEVASETVHSVYQRRNEITAKVLEDKKLDAADGKLLMSIALKEFRSKLFTMGKVELSKKDDNQLIPILEGAYGKLKILRDTIKANTEKK